MTNKQIVDKDTGEVIDINEIKKAIQEKAIEKVNEANKDIFELDLPLELKIIKVKGIDYSTCSVKENYQFEKVYNVDVRELMKSGNLSKSAKVFIATFESYIYFPTNSIVVDGHNPTTEEICEMVDLKRSSVFSLLNELEQKDVICRCKLNGDTIIYFNPFLYASGTSIHVDTVKMFKDSIYNPQNNSADKRD